MSMLEKWLIERSARVDARAGVDSIDDRITGELGPKPVFNPVANPEHGEIARTLASRARVEELREDLERKQNELANHASPFILALGFLVFIGIEVWGCFMVLRDLGLAPSERVPLGIGLAVGLIGITGVVAQRTATNLDPKSDVARSVAGRFIEAAKRSLFTCVVLIAYVLVIGALVILRIIYATGEGAPVAGVIAQALLLVAISVGPAWVAEWFFRQRRPARRSWKDLRLLRRRLRDAEQSWNRAQSAVNRMGREGTRWDTEAARRRARYQTEHRLETKKVIDEQSAKTRASRPQSTRNPRAESRRNDHGQ